MHFGWETLPGAPRARAQWGMRALPGHLLKQLPFWHLLTCELSLLFQGTQGASYWVFCSFSYFISVTKVALILAWLCTGSRKRETEKGNYLHLTKLICCHQELNPDTKNLTYPSLVGTKRRAPFDCSPGSDGKPSWEINCSHHSSEDSFLARNNKSYAGWEEVSLG